MTREARLLCDLADHSGARFAWGARALDPLDALRHEEVTLSLLKLGLFSMGIMTMAKMEVAPSPSLAPLPFVPAAILGLGFSYAIDVAPKGASGAISVEALHEHVGWIEKHFGPVAVDRELAAQVTRHAARLAAERGPGGDPAGKGGER